MELTKAVVPVSSSAPEVLPLPESEALFSSLIYDTSQQIQLTMESILKMTSEVDQSSSEIAGELEKCKEFGASRQQHLVEEKQRVQKAAYAVLEMLHA